MSVDLLVVRSDVWVVVFRGFVKSFFWLFKSQSKFALLYIAPSFVHFKSLLFKAFLNYTSSELFSYCYILLGVHKIVCFPSYLLKKEKKYNVFNTPKEKVGGPRGWPL